MPNPFSALVSLGSMFSFLGDPWVKWPLVAVVCLAIVGATVARLLLKRPKPFPLVKAEVLFIEEGPLLDNLSRFLVPGGAGAKPGSPRNSRRASFRVFSSLGGIMDSYIIKVTIDDPNNAMPSPVLREWLARSGVFMRESSHFLTGTADNGATFQMYISERACGGRGEIGVMLWISPVVAQSTV